MSMNLTGRLIEFNIKSGATSTLILNVTTSSGTAKNMSSTSTYATAKWKVWQPDGTLIINGDATISDQSETFNFTIEDSY